MKTCYICHTTKDNNNFTGVKNKCRSCVKEYNRTYRLGQKTVASQVRNEKKKHATPTWLTEEQKAKTRDIYSRSKNKTIETGIKHNVDHIVPLNGKNMCGLHVPDNLRVIPAKENFKKTNKYFEDDGWD